MATDIDLIFIDKCENCCCEYESNDRIWYNDSKQSYLCEECFVSKLSDEKCRGNSRHLCKNIECKKCYLMSFASHEKSKYWSKENKLISREVFKSSNNKVLFNCVCGHTFFNIPHSISDGQWCSYCSNPPKKLCKNNCEPCYNKSFASHEKSKYLSKKII